MLCYYSLFVVKELAHMNLLNFLDVRNRLMCVSIG